MARSLLLIAASIFFASSISACSSNIEKSASSETVTGTGKSKSETRKVGAFHAIDIDLPATLIVKVGSDGDMTVETDETVLPHITTKVEDGKLRITSDTNIQSMHELKISVNTSKLDDLKVDGAGKISLDGFSGGKLNVESDGASTITANGKLDKFDASLNGAGDVHAGGLEAKKAKVSITGAGNAEVNASEQLDASITGAGNIKYKGDPKIHQQINGVGNISKLAS
jgi:hypothetical protein